MAEILDFVLKILRNRKIQHNVKWVYITEKSLHHGKYPEPALPHFEPCVKKDDTFEQSRAEIAKIFNNYDALVKIASDYDILIDFLKVYKGPCYRIALDKAKEYAEFLSTRLSFHSGDKKIFDENEKVKWGNAEHIYFSEYKEDFKRYSKIKSGRFPAKRRRRA